MGIIWGESKLITTAKIQIQKDEPCIEPSWKQSKRFLVKCDARKTSKLTIQRNYSNYINNRAETDKLPLGKTANSLRSGGALEGFDRAKHLLLTIHGYKCSCCGKSFLAKDGTVRMGLVQFHHIVPLYNPYTKTGTNNNDITNIVPICSGCHRREHVVINIAQQSEATA